MTLRVQTRQGYFIAGSGIGLCRPTSEEAGVGSGPVVFVAALWS